MDKFGGSEKYEINILINNKTKIGRSKAKANKEKQNKTKKERMKQKKR